VLPPPLRSPRQIEMFCDERRDEGTQKQGGG
jgi:hypothetical protein